MTLVFPRGPSSLVSLGIGVHEIAELISVGKKVGAFTRTQPQDRNLADFMQVDIGNVITRRNLIDVVALHKRWDIITTFLRNGAPVAMKSIDEFSWFMILVVAALDAAIGPPHVLQVASQLLLGLFEDDPEGTAYLVRETPQLIAGWRSAACAQGILAKGEQSYNTFTQDGGRSTGWTTDYDEIIRLLRWLSTGRNGRFVTMSVGAFCLTIVLRDLGLRQILPIETTVSEGSQNIDSDSLCIVLIARPSSATTIQFRISEGGHEDISSRDMLPFQYVDRLGRGAYAVVDAVKDGATGRIFAHKSLSYTSQDNSAKDAFKNEINIMKRLQDHPHIIRIYWSYTRGRELGMLLTPVASHKDLGAYLLDIQDKGKPLTSTQYAVLIRAFGCLASGLAYIHHHTVRHKDIKPKNILIHDGRIIYTDFGVALDASGEDTTTIGMATGFSRRYCAPEVAKNEPRNRKSDVFSLGCVYLEIMDVIIREAHFDVSESRPYCERIDDIQNKLMRLSSSDVSSLGRQLILLCSRMMAYQITDRIDAEDLFQSLLLEEIRATRTFKLFCGSCGRLATQVQQPLAS